MISGTISLPGDKSISHRAALFSALRDGVSEFSNFNLNDDCRATLNCLRELGINYKLNERQLTVFGKDRLSWKKPENVLDAQNSGTTARLISGLLAAQSFETILTGDHSLSKRPMSRVIDPLTLMGGKLTSNNTYLPITFSPPGKLHAIEYKLPVASAQVKSAVLLAGLFTETDTIVIESESSRDHTERILGLKQEVTSNSKKIYSSSAVNIPELSMKIPGDFSSAAFYMAAALIIPGSELTISDISLNPTRTGFLNVLREMGAKFEIKIKADRPEPIGEIKTHYSTLRNIEIKKEIIPNIIDEIPILAIIATRSEGRFIIRNAKELRFKESDRIKTIVNNLSSLGVNVEEYDDGFSITGPQDLKSGLIETRGDHRIAMAFTIAGLISKGSLTIDNPNCASVSFPEFYTILKKINH